MSTLDREDRVLVGEDVLVEDDRIARGRTARRRRRAVRSGDRRLRAAGDARARQRPLPLLRPIPARHVGGAAARDVDPLREPIFNPVLGERALRIRSQLCAAETVLSRTTACVDNMHPSELSVELLGAQLQGYLDVGLRICSAPMIWDRPFTQTCRSWTPSCRRKRLDGSPRF